jgi:hypothetical protein
MDAISYEECCFILDAFRPDGLIGENEIAIRVGVEEAGPRLTLVALKSPRIPRWFHYSFGGKPKQIETEVKGGFPSRRRSTASRRVGELAGRSARATVGKRGNPVPPAGSFRGSAPAW